jgi:acetylornithine deacetylase
MPTELKTRSDATTILSELIAIDTTSHRSNLPFVEHVERYLKPFGIRVERIGDVAGGKTNLFVSIGPADTAGYILSGHCDTVPVEGQNWQSNPFQLDQRDGKLFGRGTCDMKGFLATCLALVPRMAAGPLRRPIHLAISYDEEIGCVGVRPMLAELASRRLPVLGCFVGEPTSMKVVIGHKGKRAFRTVVTGRSAHSSLAPESVNAVEWAGRLMEHIRRVGTEFQEQGAKDELYDVPHSTVLSTVIHGGFAVNIVPDTCALDWEFRTIAADDPDAIEQGIRSHAEEQFVPEMQRRHAGAGIAFTRSLSYPGLDTAPEDKIVQLAKTLAGANSLHKVAFGTEAGLFSEALGVPAVVIGPGSIGQAHKPDEFVEISQLDASLSFIEALIDRCCTP